MNRTALLMASLWLVLSAGSCGAVSQGAPMSARQSPPFLGEQHSYSIDFLFFKRLAAARLAFSATEDPGVFRAELVGETHGVAAWLTRERTQHYVSKMQLLPDGHLRSLEHESRILKRKRDGWHDRGKRYRFNYSQGKVFQEKSLDGHYRPGAVFDLPADGEPADILTAFFNLRAGRYGPLLPGADLVIPTVSSKGLSDITIHVLTPQEQRKHRYFPSSGLLLRVHIDQEVFETDSGDLYVWFNDDGIPERGIVEDIIGMGDVRGYLEEVNHE